MFSYELCLTLAPIPPQLTPSGPTSLAHDCVKGIDDSNPKNQPNPHTSLGKYGESSKPLFGVQIPPWFVLSDRNQVEQYLSRIGEKQFTNKMDNGFDN
jgi:hypothetical protein